MDKRQHNQKREKRTTIAVLAIFTVATVFLFGHISAVAGFAGMGAGIDAAISHIKSSPLDVLHFDPYAAYFMAGFYIIGVVTALSRADKPKAEMKYEEHGSNDFQDGYETMVFLEKNTTDILELDEEGLWKHGSTKAG